MAGRVDPACIPQSEKSDLGKHYTLKPNIFQYSGYNSCSKDETKIKCYV